MKPLARKHRLALLAVGLVASAGVGLGLGRAYERRVVREEPVPSASDEREEGAVLAEAMDLEQAPAAGPEDAGTRPTLEGLGKPGRTGQAALRARLPLPPRAGKLVSLGEQLVAHGVPMQLASFETEARARDVLAFYARHFEAQGWPYSDVPGARGDVPYPALSATLPEDDVQLTVMVMPHGEGPGCTVVLGQADMEAWRRGTYGEDAADLPVYPSTRPSTRPVVVRSLAEGLADLTVSFDTPDAPDVVEAFYRKSLTERGYSLVADAEESQGRAVGLRTLSFAGRRGHRWNLSLSARDGRTAITAHGTAPQEATP
jgi:hypothetical protein